MCCEHGLPVRLTAGMLGTCCRMLQLHWRVVLQVVDTHAKELFACLGKPNGLDCDLVQGMTSTNTDRAEQFVSTLAARPDDEQDGGQNKNNIERFLWEYLANRTHTGEAEQVADGDKMIGCKHSKQPCADGKVCLLL